MSDSQAKSRNFLLDILKILMSYLVIFIHFGYRDGFLFPCTRIAVPVFFILSGYFVYSEDKNIMLAKTKKYLLSTIKYLIIGLCIYVAFDFINLGLINNDWNGFLYSINPLIIGHDFIFSQSPITSGGHLWFLVCSIFIAIMHYLCTKFNLLKIYKFIVFPLLLLHLILYVYLGNNSVGLYEVRNSWLFGFPFFAIGMFICVLNKQYKPSKKLLIVLSISAILFFVLQYFESELYNLWFNKKAEFFISSVLCSICLVVVCTNINIQFENGYKWIGKGMYLWIYILHFAVGNILKLKDDSGVVASLIIWIVCILIYESIYLLIKLAKVVRDKKR